MEIFLGIGLIIALLLILNLLKEIKTIQRLITSIFATLYLKFDITTEEAGNCLDKCAEKNIDIVTKK